MVPHVRLFLYGVQFQVSRLSNMWLIFSDMFSESMPKLYRV